MPRCPVESEEAHEPIGNVVVGGGGVGGGGRVYTRKISLLFQTSFIIEYILYFIFLKIKILLSRNKTFISKIIIFYYQKNKICHFLKFICFHKIYDFHTFYLKGFLWISENIVVAPFRSHPMAVPH